MRSSDVMLTEFSIMGVMKGAFEWYFVPSLVCVLIDMTVHIGDCFVPTAYMHDVRWVETKINILNRAVLLDFPQLSLGERFTIAKYVATSRSGTKKFITCLIARYSKPKV